MQNVNLIDREFEVFIHANDIAKRVKELADFINRDYKDEVPLIIAVLNGSFIFAADLVRQLTIQHSIEFIKVSSYAGTQSTGTISEIIGLNTSINEKKIILLEDIIDTGLTLNTLINRLLVQNPASINVCALITKPDMLKVNLKAQYTGFHIPPKFVVGYGLDYNGLGRNLPHIYAEKT
jgi:hypoxanthine phosphoribosyltransferase